MMLLQNFSYAVKLVQNLFLTKYWTFLAKLKLFLIGASVGQGLVVSGPINVHLHRSGVLKIGKNCRFNSGFMNNPVGGFRKLNLWIGANASLVIGNEVGLSNCTLVATQKVEICDQVMIGGDVSVYDTDFHSLNADKRLSKPDKSVMRKDVLIGKKSFIGAHSIILKGACIGEESILGAGSVLIKSIPPKEIWAGNPASFIKKI